MSVQKMFTNNLINCLSCSHYHPEHYFHFSKQENCHAVALRSSHSWPTEIHQDTQNINRVALVGFIDYLFLMCIIFNGAYFMCCLQLYLYSVLTSGSEYYHLTERSHSENSLHGCCDDL